MIERTGSKPTPDSSPPLTCRHCRDGHCREWHRFCIPTRHRPVLAATALTPRLIEPSTRQRHPVNLYVVPNVFHEHAVYLRYICAFYDRLPKLSVFLHGHRTSWHNRHTAAVDALLKMDLQAAASGGSVYRSFNDYSQCWRDGRGEWADEMLAQRQGWMREMEPGVGAAPSLKESYCCTQFLVSADRIRKRPHEFWRRLLADLLDPAVPQVCKVSGHVLELTWGYLLGEPANATCRRDGYGAAHPQQVSHPHRAGASHRAGPGRHHLRVAAG